MVKVRGRKEINGIVDLTLQAVHKRNWKRNMGFWKVSELERKRVPWGANMWQRWEEGTNGKMAAARKAAREQEKGGKGEKQNLLDVRKTGHIAAWCQTGGSKNVYAIDEEDNEHVDNANNSEEDLQAWCLLEEAKTSSGRRRSADVQNKK